MKLIDIAKQIDKSRKNEDFIYISKFAYNEFNIDLDHTEQDQLKCYGVRNLR